jgi:hypothetical protein
LSLAALLLLVSHLDFTTGSFLLCQFVNVLRNLYKSFQNIIYILLSPTKAILPSMESTPFPSGLILSIIGNCKDYLYFLGGAFENDLRNAAELRYS